MKIFFILIAFVSLFFIGCSTSYNASEFKSKDDFYTQFNDDARNELLSIGVKKDSNLTCTISVEDGQIQNDSLIIKNLISKTENKKVYLNDIEHILYKNPEYTSAHLTLKDGSEYDIENLSVQQGLLNFQLKENEITQKEISLSEINKINFNVYSEGTGKGILCGMAAGLIVALSQVIHVYSDQMPQPDEPRSYNFPAVAIFTIPLGGIIGGIIGRFIGHAYTYEFNP